MKQVQAAKRNVQRAQRAATRKRAQEKRIRGRSKMGKAELIRALRASG